MALKGNRQYKRDSLYTVQDLPMHRDAEDLLHGREDFGYFFWAPVSSMLRDDNGLVDIYNNSMSKELPLCAITGVK